MRPRWRWALVGGAASLFVSALAFGQELPAELTIPFADQEARIEGERLVAVAVGMPDERVGQFGARRASARERGRARAVAMLHAFADAALARVQASPEEATRLHAAIDAHAEVRGVRPLVEGGAVVVVDLPRARLRAVRAGRGLPW